MRLVRKGTLKGIRRERFVFDQRNEKRRPKNNSNGKRNAKFTTPNGQDTVPIDDVVGYVHDLTSLPYACFASQPVVHHAINPDLHFLSAFFQDGIMLSGLNPLDDVV